MYVHLSISLESCEWVIFYMSVVKYTRRQAALPHHCKCGVVFIARVIVMLMHILGIITLFCGSCYFCCCCFVFCFWVIFFFTDVSDNLPQSKVSFPTY